MNDLLTYFDSLTIDNYESFSILSPKFELPQSAQFFDSLLIQNVKREIEGKEYSFLAIKNIEIKKAYRSEKIFSHMLDVLESKKIPIFIDDIINHRLFLFLTKRGYKNLKHKSSYGWKRSMYML